MHQLPIHDHYLLFVLFHGIHQPEDVSFGIHDDFDAMQLQQFFRSLRPSCPCPFLRSHEKNYRIPWSNNGERHMLFVECSRHKKLHLAVASSGVTLSRNSLRERGSRRSLSFLRASEIGT